jgi:hypothetical protein
MEQTNEEELSENLISIQELLKLSADKIDKVLAKIVHQSS